MAMTHSPKFGSFQDFFIHELEDLYDAESRLTKALPKMADAASNPQLKAAFEDHLKETKNHITRLDQVFNLLGRKPHSETCEAMKGLIKEGEEALHAKADSEIKDAALIAAAQRVEHYEMAGYGSARTYAQTLGYAEAAKLLQETLNEEGAADHKLTGIAESIVNPKAKTH